jgi:hypothetical protein
MSETIDTEFERLMNAEQTLIQLEAGQVLTQQMVDDLRLLDKNHRDDFDRSIDAFDKGYQVGLERGSGADTAKLIQDRDKARNRAAIANAMRSAGERHAFIIGAQVCREMIARFVEQAGDKATAGSIRANWRPTWGVDPGAPDEQVYQDAKPAEITCKPHPDDFPESVA